MIKNCYMRHENGNCLPAGGFCTANKNICEALHNAYEMGKSEQRTDLLKAEIKRMKRSFTTCINSDYYTGYMSALSAVEGYIANVEGANNDI